MSNAKNGIKVTEWLSTLNDDEDKLNGLIETIGKTTIQLKN